MKKDAKTLLVALGGNALIKKGQQGTIEQQFANLKVPLHQLARLSRKYRLIITHGNGPQVGNLLLQQECCETVPRLPLEILVAQTQGQIGYMIESTLDSELMKLGVHDDQKVITVISYIVVDENDPAFENPSKPIGPVFTREQALCLPYPTKKTAKGYRRTVVSPKPVTIVEKREIKHLIDSNFIVICCGGGGIPVVREGRRFCGVDAVIDKDLASAKLAREVGVDIFVIATDEPGVAIDYGTDLQRFLPVLSENEALDLLNSGVLPPGSMGPKVQACLEFLRNGGDKAVITDLKDIEKAVENSAGTRLAL
ncbi:MAG: carbamate kinase [Desulfobacteraceae bacterium]|nr:carbamate kinase [Desulfobacteraceae bacterium]